MDKLLFATDGSESANLAGEYVRKFLETNEKAELIVLHVIYNPFLIDVSTWNPQSVFDQMAEEQQRMSTRIEAECRQTFADHLERVRYVTATGYPADEVVKMAERENVDMIVVGSHGKGAVDRLLLGSVSHAILNRAHCSVLVVK